MSQASELGGGSRCGLGFVTHQFFKPQGKKKELAGVAGLWYISFSKWKVRKIARIKLQEGKILVKNTQEIVIVFALAHNTCMWRTFHPWDASQHAAQESHRNWIIHKHRDVPKSVLERLFDDNVIRYFMFWKKESPQNNLWVPHSQEISEDVTRVRSASSILVTRPKVWALAPRATRALDEFS